MTLRIMLVGLVASLGFELPSGPDVSRWAQAGATWARMLHPSGPPVEPKLDPAGPADCRQVDEVFEVPALAVERETAADAAFQVASEAIAADLSADLLATRRSEESAVPAGPLVAVEAPAPVITAEPKPEPAGCLVVPADEAMAAELVWVEPDQPVDPPSGPAERPDRISTAVRLTREAVQAWAAVIQEGVDDGQPTR